MQFWTYYMRTSIINYALAFVFGVMVGLLIAYLIFSNLPDYPYIHGLIT